MFFFFIFFSYGQCLAPKKCILSANILSTSMELEYPENIKEHAKWNLFLSVVKSSDKITVHSPFFVIFTPFFCLFGTTPPPLHFALTHLPTLLFSLYEQYKEDKHN